MLVERFIELLAKKKSGILTLPEKRELDTYLIENEDSDIISDMLDEVFDRKFDIEDRFEEKYIQAQLKSLNIRIDQYDGSKKIYQIGFWSKLIAVAAIVPLVIFSIAYYYKQESPIISPEVISTKKGSKSTIVLPDGTKVWINADSRLTYNENNWHKSRDVELVGEAYFDVVKDKKRPFFVHTPIMDIKVLGTAFNVRAYSDENKTETTLLRGSVEVYLKNKVREKITLTPNEKLVVKNDYSLSGDKQKASSNDFSSENDAAIQLLTVKPNPIDSTTRDIQWTKNRLVFEKEKFTEIIPVLERWYNVKVIIKKKNLIEKRFSGIFENDSLEDILQTFQFSIGFNYSVQKDTVLIY